MLLQLFEQIANTFWFVISRPRLALMLVVLPVFIPVATFRLALSMVSGRLTLLPLRSNVNYSIQEHPKRFIYYFVVLLFVDLLSMLGLWAAVKIAIEQPT